MTTILLLGTGSGLGLWLIWRALTARPTLAEIGATMAAQGQAVKSPARPATEQLEQRLVGRLLAALKVMGLDPARRSADLRVTGRSVEQHALTKIGAGVAGAVIATIVVGLVLHVGVLVTLVVVVMLGAAGFLLPDLTLTDQAKEARKAWRHAFGAYLDLVNVIEAAGAGPETALFTAADRGSGPAFDDIRRALALSRRAKRPVWDVLAELGRDLDIPELAEFAASLALVQNQGARIRTTLAAKADAMRAQLIAEVKAEADTATERMTIPVVLLLFAFLVLIAYPAVVNIGQVGSP